MYEQKCTTCGNPYETESKHEIGACLECKLEAENAKLRARIEKLETVLSQTLGEVVGNEGRLPLDKWEYANKILFNEQAEKEGK